jgi:hypothetical protein
MFLVASTGRPERRRLVSSLGYEPAVVPQRSIFAKPSTPLYRLWIAVAVLEEDPSTVLLELGRMCLDDHVRAALRENPLRTLESFDLIAIDVEFDQIGDEKFRRQVIEGCPFVASRDSGLSDDYLVTIWGIRSGIYPDLFQSLLSRVHRDDVGTG